MKKQTIFFEREQINISGTLFSYSFLCERKLWLYYHKISFEHQSELVALGKVIDETTYIRENHKVNIEGIISIDYIKKNVVHEVKKSDKLSLMAVQQLKYYLYILSKKGINMTGMIRYPLLKKTEAVSLEGEDKKVIEKRLKDIRSIVSLNQPPDAIRQKACYKCAYFEFCFSD